MDAPDVRRGRHTPVSAPSPWKRESAGRYRSSDGRFVVDSEGGRWFLRDESEQDEFGMPRTSGPFGTLAAAREAARDRRTHPAERSPLAGHARRAEQRRRGGPQVEPEPEAKKDSRPEPEHPSAPHWMDRLAARDPARARAARGWIADLRRLGVEDAEDVVRREVESDRPRIAARLLAIAIERRLRDELTSDALLNAARRARVDVEDPAAFAAFAVAKTAEVLLDEVSMSDRLTDAPARLPGWSLVERIAQPPGRPIRLTADELGRDERGNDAAGESNE